MNDLAVVLSLLVDVCYEYRWELFLTCFVCWIIANGFVILIGASWLRPGWWVDVINVVFIVFVAVWVLTVVGMGIGFVSAVLK